MSLKTGALAVWSCVFLLIGAILLYIKLTYWPGHGEGQNVYILFLGVGLGLAVSSTVCFLEDKK